MMAITPSALDFLEENRVRNSREWFAEHKKDYQSKVLLPLEQLAEELAPAMEKMDPELVTEPKRCVSRIYRDTRFSKDKSLYRDVMWCAFSRDKKIYDCPPGFVLEISPAGFRYGCGYYAAPAQNMERMRESILNGDGSFLEAQAAYQGQSRFQLEGEHYKRPRFPKEPEEKRQWLERRGIALMHNSKDFDLLFSNELGSVLAQDFLQLAPIYHFLLHTVSVRQEA